MEYFCHVWPDAPSCYLVILDKLLNQECTTVSPTLAASLEPLAHRRNVASLSLFYSIMPAFFDRSNNTGAIDVKIDGSVFEEKSSFKVMGLTFSSKLDWVFYITSIAKNTSKKIGALIHSMKLLSPEVALYLYKSTIQPCMKYCCYVWVGAPTFKSQKRICRTILLPLLPLLKPWLIHKM